MRSHATVNNGTASITLPDDACDDLTISFSSYLLPDGVQPYSYQRLFKTQTRDHLQSGETYQFSVDVPPCGYQSDLYLGEKIPFLVDDVGHPTDKIIAWDVVDKTSACKDECTPSNKPFWDGNFETDKSAHTGSMILETDQGFSHVSIDEPNSRNIALLDVRRPDGSSIGGLTRENKLNGTVRDGYQKITYDKSDDFIDEVKVIVTALNAGKSRFMFHVSDYCTYQAQVDPVLQLTAPTRSAQEGSYPNPFRSETTIRYTAPKTALVHLTIYDLAGRRVRTLVVGQREPGTHRVRWDGTAATGERVASGVYFYRLRIGSQVKTHKIVVAR